MRYVLLRVLGYHADDFAYADLLVATDCMSPEDDHRESGCYHDTVDKNTGVLAVRASENGIAAMAEWKVHSTGRHHGVVGLALC